MDIDKGLTELLGFSKNEIATLDTLFHKMEAYITSNGSPEECQLLERLIDLISAKTKSASDTLD